MTVSRAPAHLSRTLVTVALVLSGACGDTVVEPGAVGSLDVDLSAPWATASVGSVGGSEEAVAVGLEAARSNHRLRSLLVVKDGRLVVEEYFGGNARDSLNDVRSVTKSVVSALTGIALERGDIGSLDDPIGDYLVSLVGGMDPEKAAITVGHLLTMSSGLAWEESGTQEYNDWILSGDHLTYLLDRPFAAPPGTQFAYNSAAVHLLGVVVEQATGMRLPELARQTLFDPIGIGEARWESLGGGFTNGGAGLDLRPRDLARFGQLYLQGGVSAGRQIVPAGWVELSSLARFGWQFDAGSLQGITYGMLWWVVPDATEPFYFAWGYGGQYVVVVPESNLVVVATNDWRAVSLDGGAERYEQATMSVIVDHLIPALR